MSIVFIFSLSIIIFSLYTGITPMPSSNKIKESLLKEIVGKPQKIIELGSGWGGIAFLFSQYYPYSIVKGIEISPVPWLFSTILKRLRRRENLSFYKKNFFHIHLEEADLIFCYLCPSLMKKLKVKFENELLPGTWVISSIFSIPGWFPEKILKIDDLWKSKLYIYKI